VYCVRAELVEALLDEEPFDELRANGDSIRIQLLQATSSQLLAALQCLSQIPDQILDILDSNRQSNQRVIDAQRLALLHRYGRVSHQAGMVDEAFDAT
jgi:hypothetical protein